MASIRIKMKLKLFKHLTQHLDKLDDLLNTNTLNVDGLLGGIYPPEVQFNKANASDSKTPFLDLYLPISNDLTPQ